MPDVNAHDLFEHQLAASSIESRMFDVLVDDVPHGDKLADTSATPGAK